MAPADNRAADACLDSHLVDPDVEATRRIVTVVFADMVGSTGLAERLDAEVVRSVQARYFGVLRRTIEAHGGTVEKYIGDAVMAVFGVPVLHEDDALRAVRAAAAMADREVPEVSFRQTPPATS